MALLDVDLSAAVLSIRVVYLRAVAKY